MNLTLEIVPGTYGITRLDADAPVPPAVLEASTFVSVTRTSDELSIVAPIDDGEWAALRVAGTLDFTLVGILASLTGTLAAAAIPVFAVSTHDTDYLLVRTGDLDRAVDALRLAGHEL